ncbi:MAG: hypothetical protein HW416_1763 [Chloroflexi bacterium]|nr:hypothetical protein [Chloroflexota bacterium]
MVRDYDIGPGVPRCNQPWATSIRVVVELPGIDCVLVDAKEVSQTGGKASPDHVLTHVVTAKAHARRDARNSQFGAGQGQKCQVRSITGRANPSQPRRIAAPGQGRLEGEIRSRCREMPDAAKHHSPSGQRDRLRPKRRQPLCDGVRVDEFGHGQGALQQVGGRRRLASAIRASHDDDKG